MKKHYILLWLDDPGYDKPEAAMYFETLIGLGGELAKKYQDIRRVGPHAWLMPRDTSLPFLLEYIGRASQHSIKYHTLYLDDDGNGES